MRLINVTIFLFGLIGPFLCMAEDRIELEITTIKGNKELPRILYIVPWKDIEESKSEEQKLVLHSLFGDLFDPVYPMHLQSKE